MDLARVSNALAINCCVAVPSNDSLPTVVRSNENNKHPINARGVFRQGRIDLPKVDALSYDAEGPVQRSVKIGEEIESFVAQMVLGVFAASFWPLVALLRPGVEMHAANANKHNPTRWFHQTLNVSSREESRAVIIGFWP